MIRDLLSYFFYFRRIERTLREKLMEWRPRHITKFNRYGLNLTLYFPLPGFLVSIFFLFLAKVY